MSVEKQGLKYEITAEDKGVAKATGGIKSALNGLQQALPGALGPLSEVVDKAREMGEAYETHGHRATVAIGKLGTVGLGAGLALQTMAAGDIESMGNLKSAIEVTGGSYEDYEKQIESLIGSSAKLGFTDGQVTASLATLTTATNDPEKAMKEYQVAVDLAARSHISLESASSQVAKALNGSGRLFKQYGVEVKTNADGTKDYTAAVDELGRKLDGSAARSSETFTGRLRGVRAEIENVVSSIGEKYGPAITAVSGGMMGVSASVTAVSKGLDLLRARQAAAAIQATQAAAALQAEGAAGLTAGAEVAEGAAVAEVGISGLKLALISTGVGAVLVGIGTAVTLAFGHDSQSTVDEFTAAVERDNGALAENSRLVAYNALKKEGALDIGRRLGVNEKDLVDAASGHADAMGRVSSQISQYINVQGTGNEKSADALGLLDMLAGQSKLAAAGLEEYNRKTQDGVTGTGEAVGSLGALATAIGQQPGMQAELSVAAAHAGDAIAGEGRKANLTADDINVLKTALDGINGKQRSAADAAADYEQAIDDLDAAVKKNKSTLDIHTQAGRDNQRAVETATQAMKDKAAADLAAHKPAEMVIETFNGQYDALVRKVAPAFDGSTKKAEVYLRKLGLIPKDIETMIRATANITINRIDTASNNGAAAHGVVIAHHATGGYINGAGTSTSDSIPSMLSNGEFVVNAQATAQVRPLLEQINAGHAAAAALPRAGSYATSAMSEMSAAMKGAPSDVAGLSSALRAQEAEVTKLGAAYDKVNAVYEAADHEYKAAKGDVDRLTESLKKKRAADAEDLRHTTLKGKALAELRARYKDEEAALQKQIDKAKLVAKTAKESETTVEQARSKAKQAADDVKATMIETGKALGAIVKQQADAFTQEVQSFHDTMADAVTGGKLDISRLILDPNGSNGGAGWLQVNLDTLKQQATHFRDDLKALAADGASQDLIAQIAGMGPDQGAALADSLLQGGADAVHQIDTTMGEIQDIAGGAADDLTASFYAPGASAMDKFIAGMKSKFPALAAFFDGLEKQVDAAMAAAGLTTNTGGSVNAGAGGAYGGSLASSLHPAQTIHVVLPSGDKLATVVAPYIRQGAQKTANLAGAYVR